MNYVVINHPVIKEIIPHHINASESVVHVIGDFVEKTSMPHLILASQSFHQWCHMNTQKKVS